MKRAKCEFCDEVKSHMPPVDEMPGSFALLFSDGLILSSVHIELSSETTKSIMAKYIRKVAHIPIEQEEEKEQKK